MLLLASNQHVLMMMTMLMVMMLLMMLLLIFTGSSDGRTSTSQGEAAYNGSSRVGCKPLRMRVARESIFLPARSLCEGLPRQRAPSCCSFPPSSRAQHPHTEHTLKPKAKTIE